MKKLILVICSAAAASAAFILFREHAAELPALTATAFGATAPIAGVALAFPAVYLLWEQSEM